MLWGIVALIALGIIATAIAAEVLARRGDDVPSADPGPGVQASCPECGETVRKLPGNTVLCPMCGSEISPNRTT